MRIFERIKEKRFSLVAIVVAVLLTVTLTMGLALGAVWILGGTDGLTLLYSSMLINGSFVGEYDRGEMTDAALTGMVDALGDRWSVYLDREWYHSSLQQRENAYVGIGITYLRDGDSSGMVIQEVKKGSPAEAAGLKAGERIVAVFGVTLNADSFDGAVGQIAGEPGKVIELTVEGPEGVSREVSVTLARVETPPVTYEMLEGDIGYVRIANFFSNCARDTRAAVEDLQSRGARALLFDVRDDPGGYVAELTRLLDYLLPEGPIFSEHVKGGPVQVTNSDAACVDLPMAVLVNSESYSAAELFAAQLRESVGAKVVGQQTCGKGYYQVLLPLPNGGALNLSTGEYGTGAGVSLIGVGLTPDVVEDDPEVQLAAAAELLLAQVGG